MINLSEMWIGDWVLVKTKGLKGKFEGTTEDQQAKVNIKGKIQVLPPDDLELTEEPVDKPTVQEEETEGSQTYASQELNIKLDEIDLHIERLDPGLLQAVPDRILDSQLQAFENHFQACCEKKMLSTIIIHGKGAGVLRNHIHEFLKYHKRVFSHALVNAGGATEIIFTQ